MGRDGRIRPLSIEEAERVCEGAGVPANLAALNVFRVLLHNPPVAGALSGLLTRLLWEPRLDPRLRELVILRIGWVTGSVYEWTQHWRVARGMGMTPEELIGVRDWKNHEGYGEVERAVLAATDDTLETGTIRPETWKACEKMPGGPDQLVELVIAIGNWRMFSSLLRSLAIPLEEGVEPWPPDGEVPPAARQ